MGNGLMKEFCSEKLIHGHEIFANGHGNFGFNMYPILSPGNYVVCERKPWLGSWENCI